MMLTLYLLCSYSINPLVVMFLLMAITFWIHRFCRTMWRFYKFWEIRTFYTEALKIPPVSTHTHCHTHTHTHTHTSTHCHTHTYLPTYLPTCVQTHTHTHAHTHTHTRTHTHTHTQAHTVTHTYLPTYLHVYKHTHTHTRTLTESAKKLHLARCGCKTERSSEGIQDEHQESRTHRTGLAYTVLVYACVGHQST